MEAVRQLWSTDGQELTLLDWVYAEASIRWLVPRCNFCPWKCGAEGLSGQIERVLEEAEGCHGRNLEGRQETGPVPTLSATAFVTKDKSLKFWGPLLPYL